MKHCIALFLILLTVSLKAQDVHSIISKTETAYANLNVYLDSGRVISNFYNTASPHKSALIFKTAYRKTGEFNFEFYKLGNDRLFVVNRDENGKVMQWRWNSIISGSSYASAVAGATGISSGSIGMISNLLMPNQQMVYGKSIFQRIEDEKLEDSELIDGKPCFKVSGRENASDKNQTVFVWISKDDYLIRQIETDKPVNDFNVKTTYNYTPYILETYDNELFEFKPNRWVAMD